MERNQVETNKRLDENNKRLDDDMKSNMDLQQMILSMLNNFSGNESRKDGLVGSCRVQAHGETSDNAQRHISNVDAAPGDKNKSESWWDEMCHDSGDEELGISGGNKDIPASSAKRMPQVSLTVCNRYVSIEENNLIPYAKLKSSVRSYIVVKVIFNEEFGDNFLTVDILCNLQRQQFVFN